MGATLGRKRSRRLSWQIWADLGQARDAQNGGKMAELGAKMRPRWRQDDPRWGLPGHLDVDFGGILSILGGLGDDLCRNGRSVKMSTTIAFWLHFQVLGCLVGGCWAILGRLGEKLGYLGRCWPQVGSILAACWDKDGEDEPR